MSCGELVNQLAGVPTKLSCRSCFPKAPRINHLSRTDLNTVVGAARKNDDLSGLSPSRKRLSTVRQQFTCLHRQVREEAGSPQPSLLGSTASQRVCGHLIPPLEWIEIDLLNETVRQRISLHSYPSKDSKQGDPMDSTPQQNHSKEGTIDPRPQVAMSCGLTRSPCLPLSAVCMDRLVSRLVMSSLDNPSRSLACEPNEQRRRTNGGGMRNDQQATTQQQAAADPECPPMDLSATWNISCRCRGDRLSRLVRQPLLYMCARLLLT